MSNAIPSSAPGSSPYSVMSWPRLTLGDWFSHGKFLIMPASPETARLAAFQIMQLPLRGGLPTILFEQLLKRVRMYSQTDGSYGAILNRIREFYFYWSGVMPQGEAQGVVERLDRDTQSGALAVFYLEDDPRFTLIRERSGPAVLPRGDDVAGWSVKERLLAMLDAVPGAALKAFGPTVAAELRAFFFAAQFGDCGDNFCARRRGAGGAGCRWCGGYCAVFVGAGAVWLVGRVDAARFDRGGGDGGAGEKSGDD